MLGQTARREFIGEFLGTFLLVLFGCGSVAVSVLYSAHQGLFQVAIVWGIGVALAIYATRHLSGAHLNPAVTLGLAAGGRMSWRKTPVYITAQFAGAFAAAAVLYALFSSSIAAFEAAEGIVRGTPESVRTAQMFGEFYPNPGAGAHAAVSLWNALFAEAFGTFLLMLIILNLTSGANLGGPGGSLVPLFIGLLVTSIICLLAPLTQAGLNPARDLSPRLFSALVGWGNAAFPRDTGSWFTVYVLSPVVGSLLAAGLHHWVIEPALGSNQDQQP